jgi:hypothetical protein
MGGALNKDSFLFHFSPFKMVLILLFVILNMGELLDGVFDLSDCVAPILLMLYLNDLRFKYLEERTQTPKFQEEKKGEGLLVRFSMNLLFGLVFCIPFLSPDLKEFITRNDLWPKLGIVTWSLLFFAISLKAFYERKSIIKVLYCNFAIAVIAATLYYI